MKKHKLDNARILSIFPLDSPKTIRTEFPVSSKAGKTVAAGRHAAHEILHNRDDRLIVVVGPCSIHDCGAGLEYADRLRLEAKKYKNELLIIMRVYFEKPRTTVGWKGLINDPHLDQSFEINDGIRLARELLVKLNEAGVPAATEFLDLITPQYIAELISWGAIGARTTESQGHRELASGLSCPVGFKNGTDGNLKIAVDAINSASRSHHFLSLTKKGKSAVFATAGNDDCHVILRGGKRPNYDKESVEMAIKELKKSKRNPNLMIDFSHANSHKDYKKQMEVCADVSRQIANANNNIIGIMIESHLFEGRQDIGSGKNLIYGQSLTDACLGWDDTTELLATLANAVKERRDKNIL